MPPFLQASFSAFFFPTQPRSFLVRLSYPCWYALPFFLPGQPSASSFFPPLRFFPSYLFFHRGFLLSAIIFKRIETQQNQPLMDTSPPQKKTSRDPGPDKPKSLEETVHTRIIFALLCLLSAILHNLGGFLIQVLCTSPPKIGVYPGLSSHIYTYTDILYISIITFLWLSLFWFFEKKKISILSRKLLKSRVLWLRMLYIQPGRECTLNDVQGRLSPNILVLDDGTI